MSVTATTRLAMVRPPRAIVSAGVASLRAKPDDAAELVDQASYGELMTCLGRSGEWTFVQGPDLYFGWIRTSGLAEPNEGPERRIVAVLLANVHAAATETSAVVDALPAGTSLRTVPARGGWAVVAPDRYVRMDDLVAESGVVRRYPTPADLIATAESFIGVPYLWGGTSARGIDCSGLTQRVYFLNGVGLDRDADQQALGGRPVDVARPGDLFFFGAEGVTHTAIATGERTFIHAPQSGKTVQHGELTDASRIRAIRRYLP